MKRLFSAVQIARFRVFVLLRRSDRCRLLKALGTLAFMPQPLLVQQIVQFVQVVGNHAQAKHCTHLVNAAQLELA